MIGERRLADPERRDLVARAAGVVGDDRVLDVDRVQQVPDHPVGRDRRRSPRSAGASTCPATPRGGCAISRRHRGQPVARLALQPVLHLFEQRVERQPGIADRRQIDRHVLVDRRSGSSVAWAIFLPFGIGVPKLVRVKLQPMPKMKSAFCRKCQRCSPMPMPPEPSDSGWFSGKALLPGKRRHDRRFEQFGQRLQLRPGLARNARPGRRR